MHRLISGAAIATALLTAPPAAAQTEPPLSYEWAESASPQTAGQRLLGPLASLYPNYGGFSHSNFGPSWSVAFASTSRSSGMEGMCEADVIRLQFAPQRTETVAETLHSDDDHQKADPGEDGPEIAPVILLGIDTETRYRAIADTSPQSWTEEYEAGLEAACTLQTDGWAFSSAKDEFDAWYAARLQTLLPDMAASEPNALLALLTDCSGSEECRAPLVLVEQLRSARFWHGDVRPCDALADVSQSPRFEGPFCLKARYLLGGSGNEFEYLNVTARFDESVDVSRNLADPHIRAITVRRESIIVD